MIDRTDIQTRARQCRRDAIAGCPSAPTALRFLAAAMKAYDIELKVTGANSVLGPEVLGMMYRRARMIRVAERLGPEDRAFVIAHELGHYILHAGSRSESGSTTLPYVASCLPHGVLWAGGYSWRERKEVEADTFAAEFLCPSDWLAEAVTRQGRKPSEIAAVLGLNPKLVMQQAVAATLLPSRSDGAEQPEAITLDDTQQAAATWAGGNLIVEGGPGTGKTTTMVARIAWLIGCRTPPASIVALTASDPAAQTMRERLPQTVRRQAAPAWIGTFPAFGFELISKNPARVGRTERFRVLDETGALTLLEKSIGKPKSAHGKSAADGVDAPIHVLRAIMQCKERLTGAEAYLAASLRALRSAKSAKAREAAGRAHTVGRAFMRYEAALAAADALDAADLVAMPVRMLAGDPGLAARVRESIGHLLVDEYQDLGPANHALLRLLAGPEVCLWATGDRAQSAYRFRGANPAAMDGFATTFGGTLLRLGKNYRSSPPITDAIEAFGAATATAGIKRAARNATRRPGTLVQASVAPTVVGEALAIRDKIEACRADGIPYGQQALLARSHLTLRRLTEQLQALGVPLFHLGDLFDRGEVQDLLALASLDAGDAEINLARLAQMPEYAATSQDVLAVARWAKGRGETVSGALAQADRIEGLTPKGTVGLQRLGGDIVDMGPETSAWTLLTTWLYERSGYLARHLAAVDGLQGRQRLIAIHHLLKVCEEQEGQGDNDRSRIVERIRRIGALNQDTAFRKILLQAAEIDAVEVMTVHASKGREFEAVHLAGLADRYMPIRRRTPRYPPPAALRHLFETPDDHDSGEEALFLIAMSRARQQLHLTRAERYATTPAAASSFLDIRDRANQRQMR